MKNAKLAIIVPMKGKVELLMGLINSISYHSKYDRSLMKIYIADTGSSPQEKKIVNEYLKRMHDYDGIQSIFIEYNYYNFAKINNDVVKNHVDEDTDLLLLCNNDVELINDAISMVVDKYADGIGTVGARLMYKNNLVQHCGMLIKNGGVTHFLLKKPFDKKYEGTICNSYGNTGAFMLTSKKLWEDIGGLNERYKVCFEDVEYNLECLVNRKLKCLTLCDAVCFHYESLTRGRGIDKGDYGILSSFTKQLVAKKKENEAANKEGESANKTGEEKEVTTT